MDSASIEKLFEMAHASLENAILQKQETPGDVSDFQELNKPQGAFVTLYNDGQLRGCVGHIAADKPLYKTVMEMSVAAATFDPRFPVVTSKELPHISIEISVLSPFEIVTDFSTIEIGVHGLMVQLGNNRGLLLPQVAKRYHWTVEEFLAETCMKAFLPRDAYKNNDAKVSIFTAEVLTEPTLHKHE